MNLRRTLAVAMLAGAGSVLALGPAALAKGGSSVHEAVVSTIAPDGSVVSTRISQLIQLESRSGEETSLRVPRIEDLQSYRNLTGFANPAGEGDDFVWRTSDRLDAAALAKTEQDLPVRVRITYYLDGKRIDPDDIKGEDGDVKIVVDVTNLSGDPKTLRYEGVTSPFLTSTVNQYLPVEYLVRAEFPTDRWSGVTGPDVHVLPSGIEAVVASGSGFIFPPATDTSATVEFHAASEDVILPRIQVYANAHASQEYLESLQEQFDTLQALYSGFGGLGDTLTQIYDGTVELADGVDELLGGVGARDAATKEPVVELDDAGLPTTVIGTLGFLEQTIRKDVLGGIGERDKATGEGVVVKDDKGRTTTLIGGLQSQKDTYDDDLTPAIEEALVGLDGFVAQVSDGGTQLDDGLAQLLAGLGDVASAPNTTTVIGGLESLLAGLGDTANPPELVTIIGTLETIQLFALGAGQVGLAGAIGDLLSAIQTNDPGNPGFREGLVGLLAGLQTNDPDNPGFREGLVAVKDGVAALTQGVIGGLGEIRRGFTNPEFTKSQASLDGRTPKEYFQDCPACFDPTSPRFDPQTAHADFQPALLEVFTLFSEGIRDALPELQSFDPANPGLVDGLQQIADGLDTLASKLHSLDAEDPGVVEGLGLVRGGLQQVSQGLFATNELGVRTSRGQVGDQGDFAGLAKTALEDAAAQASSTGALAEDANVIRTTYVFDLAAQSTGTRDNSVRGALMALTGAGLVVLWRRPRPIG